MGCRHAGALSDVSTGDELGSGCAPPQCLPLPTRLGAHAHGSPKQQRNDDDDDEPEQLTDSEGSDGDGDGGGATSSERAGRGAAQQIAPVADIARGSTADEARCIGVCVDKRSAVNPFKAQITFNSKKYTICYRPTAEAGVRAYDAVACMIPGRALNFPTPPTAASSSRQRKGASAVPADSDILAAIAALRQAQPQPPPTGAVKYGGVSIDKRRACNPFQASIFVDGKQEYLGGNPTAEAAARTYDAASRTISVRKLNSQTGGSSAAAACGGFHMDAQSLPAPGAGQPS
jgi:hypothetical protein